MSIEKEIWKDIPGYKGVYQASSLGRIKSLPRETTTIRKGKSYTRQYEGKILSPSVSNKGYYKTTLTFNGKYRYEKVHRLVVEAFIGLPNGIIGNKRGEYQIDHKDGNKLNNRIENLEWVLSEENGARSEKRIFRFEHLGPEAKKLSKNDLVAIKALKETNRFTNFQIGGFFGISYDAVDSI